MCEKDVIGGTNTLFVVMLHSFSFRNYIQKGHRISNIILTRWIFFVPLGFNSIFIFGHLPWYIIITGVSLTRTKHKDLAPLPCTNYFDSVKIDYSSISPYFSLIVMLLFWTKIIKRRSYFRNKL